MPPDERELLNKSVALGEENNAILRSIRRSARISSVMSFVYWVFIVGTAIGSFYFLQPYFDQIKELYGSASSVLKNLKQ
jgi:TRAP-type C4-dicarboxylate transport system permease small subunit